MLLKEIEEVLKNIRFADWTFKVATDNASSRLYLQVGFRASDVEDGGQIKSWTGRKWILSEHMTKSEIVGTAFKAVLTALEHEAREQFLYIGRPIYGPHTDIDALWGACGIKDVRCPHG